MDDVDFEIAGEIRWVETIATARGIHELRRLNRIYGRTNWRKRKGICQIRLSDGAIKLAELHWYEGHGKGKKKSKSRGIWSKTMKNRFLVCVNNKGYEASLEIRKLYENITDKESERHGQVRVIDESGEDYLFPGSYFAPIRLLAETRGKILTKV